MKKYKRLSLLLLCLFLASCNNEAGSDSQIPNPSPTSQTGSNYTSTPASNSTSNSTSNSVSTSNQPSSSTSTSTAPITLNSPANLKVQKTALNKFTVTFDSVSGATSYKAQITTESGNVLDGYNNFTITSGYTLDATKFTTGTYIMKVKAQSNNAESAYSTATFVVEKSPNVTGNEVAITLVNFYNDAYASFTMSDENAFNKAFGDSFAYMKVNGVQQWCEKVGPVENGLYKFNVFVGVDLYDTNQTIKLEWCDSNGNVYLTGVRQGSTNPDTPKPDDPYVPDDPVGGNDVIEDFEPGSIEGIANVEIAKGEYFDAFEGVTAHSKGNEDVTSYLQVSGSVNFGQEGTYTLKYTLNGKNGTSLEKTRSVEVTSKSSTRSVTNPNTYPTSNTLGSGSYASGNATIPDEDFVSPNNPQGVLWNVNSKKVPTNTWFSGLFANPHNTGLLINNYRSVLKTNGISLSHIGQGGIETYKVADDTVTKEKDTTISNFTPTFDDLLITSPYLSEGYSTNVLSYSDNNVKVALTNNNKDNVVLTYTQGSPYVFMETNGALKANIQMSLDGVTKGYTYYKLDGSQIKGSYTGSSIIVKLGGRHCGYASTYPNTGVGAAKYQDSYFLITGGANTTFTPKHGIHPDATMKDGLEIANAQTNFLSIAPIEGLQDASIYAQFATNMPAKSHSYYHVDHENSTVKTTHLINCHQLEEIDETRVLMAMMPHQYKLATNLEYVGTNIPSMRGNLKLRASNIISYQDSFRGILPSFTLPTNAEFSAEKLREYLTILDNNNVSDGVFVKDSRDYLDDTTPYWNAKALYPLANGVIMADQIHDNTLKQSFINKIKTLLEDWFTYSGDTDKRFLYYNYNWGSTYYSNNSFSTASRLSDHHFTHGYLIYASSVIMMYDQDFANKYQDIANMLLMDYMNYDRSNKMYPYMRSFDTWAGHSWADGLGDTMDGNNQESCGEALNSWVAGYLFGLATGNQALVDAAIYGYTTELSAIKQYWFNYDEDNWSSELKATGIHALAIVWGAKNEYQTWFGPNPEFIYGIHWLPIGEYLTSYALGTAHQAKFNEIYNAFLATRNGEPKCWLSNMWSMQSLVNPTAALNNFDENKLKNDEYPNDLALAYYMINAMKSLGNHTDNAHATINDSCATSIYQNGSSYYAMIWNASGNEKTITVTYGDKTKSVTVPAHSFTRVNL